MNFQKRAKRLPSAWRLTLQYGADRSGEMVVELRNVSASGCRYIGPVALRIGTPVQLSIGTEDVNGHVVRRAEDGGAITFDGFLNRRQVDILCQARAENAAPEPVSEDAQTDDDLRRAISRIL